MLLDVDDTDDEISVSLNKIGRSNLFKDGFAINMVESEENIFWILSSNLELLRLEINQQFEVVSKEYIDLKKDQFEIGNRDIISIKIAVDKNKKLWIAGDRKKINEFLIWDICFLRYFLEIIDCLIFNAYSNLLL